MKPPEESFVDHRFVANLSRDLNAFRDGTARELPGLDCSPLPLLGRVAALAGLYRHFNQQTLSEFGLTGVEEQVLGILRSLQADTPSELARFTHQTPAGMTRTLDRLEARGLLARAPHPGDRRRIRVSLTDEGCDFAERKLEVQIEALHTMLAGLDEQALAGISDALDELLARLAGTRRVTAGRTT